MTQPAVYPGDAPFNTTMIPTGWSRPMTAEEADAANLLYPVPPFGDTYFPPGPPVAQPNVKFFKLSSILAMGVETAGMLRSEDVDGVQAGDIFVFWAIGGNAGIFDDIGVRSARVLDKVDDIVTFDYDSTGIDVTNLVLLGIKYIGP